MNTQFNIPVKLGRNFIKISNYYLFKLWEIVGIVQNSLKL